jgi:hypothetical protein
MPTATITATGIVRRYADDIAYVAEQDPATDLDEFTRQLGKAATNFGLARMNDFEDVEAAATILGEALDAEGDRTRPALLKRANKLLGSVSDMTEEYREMVGD